MTSARKTFVVSLRDQDGPATVHDVHTGRRARLASLREISEQIERWLREGKPRGATGLSPRRGDGRASRAEEEERPSA